MSFSNRGRFREQVRFLRRQFLQDDELPFTDVLSESAVAQALKALDVDENGLDDMDIRILSTIIEKFKGGPVGLSTIATAVGEEAETIEEMYEPFLIQEGYIKRTSRGRETTERAYKHLKIAAPPQKSRGLFD